MARSTETETEQESKSGRERNPFTFVMKTMCVSLKLRRFQLDPSTSLRCDVANQSAQIGAHIRITRTEVVRQPVTQRGLRGDVG